MKFPLMPSGGVKSVGTPEFFGGLNLRDSLNNIADNQLTQAVNMWYKDGMLRTRPAITTNKDHFYIMGRATSSQKTVSVSTRTFEDIIHTQEGKTYILSVTERTIIGSEQDLNGHTTLRFFWQGEDKVQLISDITIDGIDRSGYFVVNKGTLLYCFAGDKKIRRLDYSEETPKWEVVSEEELAPTMFIQCKTTDANGMTGVKTQVLAPNLLTPYYKMVYSTVNVEYESCTMRYPLAYMLKMAPTDENEKPTVPPITITAEHTFKKYDETDKEKFTIEKATHTVTWDSVHGTCWEAVDNDKPPVDGLKMSVNGWYVMFYKNDYTNPTSLTTDDYIPDNLVITAAYDWEAESKDKVFGMTRAEWFGGASQGINGGTRLFLGGSTTAGEGALMVWSDLNNPLYFPENNYAYVGNTEIPLTAFGKQSNMLVIYKQNEIYYTQYMRNDSISAENIDNQDVIDYTAASVYFPITQIHSTIGCDCPDTIQLCRNRLVWMCSNGKVYTLVTENQYSERNVYEVGGMVERKLAAEKKADLKAATSCDWQGHYILLYGKKMYLMDYNSSGYQYVYSYQKDEDANIRIPWYYWELNCFDNFDFQAPAISQNNGTMLISGYHEEYGATRVGRVTVIFSENQVNDNSIYENTVSTADTEAEYISISEQPIHSEMQTKLFEFGSGMYRKNVNKVGLTLGNNGGVPINVEYITDCGSSGDEITLDSDQTENYTPGYISSVALSPSIRSVLRFGVKLTCEGKMAVGRMSFDYRMLGGIK